MFLSNWVIFDSSYEADGHSRRPNTLQVLSIDLIFHPTGLPALSSAGLIDVVGHKAALPVRAWHVLIIVTLGVLVGSTGVFCHDGCRHGAGRSTNVRQFGNVTEGVRSRDGIS